MAGKDPGAPPVAITAHADVRRMLLGAMIKRDPSKALTGFDVVLQGLTSENSNMALAKHLALRGEGAYEVVLRGTSGHWVSPASEHGFRA